MMQLWNSYTTDYTAQQFMHTFSFNNSQIGFNLLIAGLTFLFGYLEYMYSFALIIKERSAPFPIWMHTFYFAHDSMGALVFALAAIKYNNFWLFWGAAGALMVWNLFEIFNLYKAIYVERDDIWGALYHNGQTPLHSAWWRVITQICLMIGIVNLFRVFMHDPLMFKWFIFTNVLMAVGPGLYWERRQTRVGASRGLAIVILLGTVNSFMPNNMWALATPYFSWHQNPWFYILGVIVILFAAYGLYVYNCLPAKPKRLGKHRSVW